VATSKAKSTSGPWLVKVGINYPPNDQRAEPGEIITDLPAICAAWMLADGVIVPADQKAEN
jgi:hypothetical protein